MWFTRIHKVQMSSQVDSDPRVQIHKIIFDKHNLR